MDGGRLTIAPTLPLSFNGFPGVVLHVSPTGTIVESNGRLELELGREVRGVSVESLLDESSSRAKWRDALTEAQRNGSLEVELIFGDDDSIHEPQPFSALWDDADDRLWLIEHPRDDRLDKLARQVGEVNAALASTQRALVRERGGLARALAELEERNKELAATTAELERSNRALDEFAHAISHDLKAPLRSIANSAEWLREDAGDALGGDSMRHIGQMRDQVRRMRIMIDGVLSYARAGRRVSEAELVDVRSLIAEITALLAPNEQVQVAMDGELPRLYTVRSALHQVLQNLIDNAIKHAHRHDPRVTVRAALVGGVWEFRVCDNGPGIAPRLQDRVWELFRTLNSDTTGQDTGIGLAVVRRIVESEGGRVWVTSEEGAGATFGFTWPEIGESDGSKPE